MVLYYGDTIASLSLQTRKTWYSEYAKLLPQWISDSFRVHQIRWASLQRFPRPRAGLRGPTSKGREENEGERKREGKGEEETLPFTNSWIRT